MMGWRMYISEYTNGFANRANKITKNISSKKPKMSYLLDSEKF